MIRDTIGDDAPAILDILRGSGQFDADGLAHVEETLAAHLADDSGEIWLTADDGEPVGVAYCAPEPMTSGTWNLLMLWTRPDREGKGLGSALVEEVERRLAESGARLLVVETSGLAEFATARAFYARCGFRCEATVRDFFDAGDDKVIYTRPVTAG